VLTWEKVLGSAINSSGGAAPPGAPVAEAQCSAMVDAFRRAQRDPQDVDYVELHATGR
jgi:acyl transferase domain-containing protein